MSCFTTALHLPWIWVGNNRDNDGGDGYVAWLSGREQQARAALHFGRQGDQRKVGDTNISTTHG